MAEAVPPLTAVAWTVAAVSVAVMTIRLFRRSYFSDTLFGAAVILFLFAAGFLLRTGEKARPGELSDRRQLVSVRLSGYPEKRNASWSFRARIISVTEDDSLSYPRGSLMLWFMSDTLPLMWKPGDQMVLHIRPRQIENNGNPCEFNYRRYLEGQGVKYMAFFRAGDIIDYRTDGRRSLRESSLTAAHAMTDAFRRAGLSGEELGLVTALTIGDKELLDKEQLTSFSRSGAMHIMAVSGLHVGMVSLALSTVLFFLRGRLQIIKPLVIVPALWGFAFITGLSPSVLRATIMFTFLQAGSMLHRPAASMNSLLASAFILTAARPAVLFEAGFQLSYLAVAFIITFYYPLYRLIRIRNRVGDWLWQMTAVSLVAQAGTLALTVRLFNIFPLLFLLTNIVVIPISFIVLLLAMLLLVTAAFPPLSAFFAVILEHLARFTLSFTGVISSMNHGVIMNIGMSSVETLLMTAASALLLTSLLKVQKITLKPFIVTALLLVVCNTVKTAQERHRERVIIYNIRGTELTVKQHGRLLLVPSSDGLIPAEVRKHADTRGLKIEIIDPG
ncbi:MAG: ComEC/Rec2 family competence protein [Bacteroidales bacterium]|nr:ComEC/Rec2 family competence protein [Bacteroidales bacterium]